MVQSNQNPRDLLESLRSNTGPKLEDLRGVITILIRKLTGPALDGVDSSLVESMSDLWRALATLQTLRSETERSLTELGKFVPFTRVSRPNHTREELAVSRVPVPTHTSPGVEVPEPEAPSSTRKRSDIHMSDIRKLNEVVLSPRLFKNLARAGVNTLEEFDVYTRDKTAEQLAADLHVSERVSRGTMVRLRGWRNYQRRSAARA